MKLDIVLQKKYEKLLPILNEQTARLYLASEAESLGRGGKQRVSRLAKVSRVRIDKGILELNSQKKKTDEGGKDPDRNNQFEYKRNIKRTNNKCKSR